MSELEWAGLMRAANAGDEAAYARLLTSLAPALRAMARRGLARTGLDEEDVVQETLLAIHLKRHTWDEGRPIGPWVRAIAHHKLVDAVRRRHGGGRRVEVPVEDVADLLPASTPDPDRAVEQVERHLEALPARQRDVVRALTMEGASVRDTARRLETSEGNVRVALHRGLKALAARFRETKR